MGDVHIFVADIHLRPQAKNEVRRFVSWLSHAAETGDAVYILGDLFDYWYSGMENSFETVIEALKSPVVHLMPGNRDFLLRNARLRGIDISHAEEVTISLSGKKILLAHGHTLTDADAGFKMLHRYGWPVIGCADRILPVSIKDRCARFMVRSSAMVRPSSADIRKDMAKARGVDLVICGHLHRHVQREGLIVLPAFFDTGAWLSWNESGPRLETFR
ncbi:MAG TPA: UDP-2,3-diacylglucosamine diphosphatase [Deltaproteobacteria bacterium]|nr:UDP-2,3-diacylglucosamine diphosphatase [Deltaproteobacteria bacterium]